MQYKRYWKFRGRIISYLPQFFSTQGSPPPLTPLGLLERSVTAKGRSGIRGVARGGVHGTSKSAAVVARGIGDAEGYID